MKVYYYGFSSCRVPFCLGGAGGKRCTHYYELYLYLPIVNDLHDQSVYNGF